MGRRAYTQHSLPVLSEGCERTFKDGLHASFLVPWAEMDPTVARRKWAGPSWVYERDGREALASVPLTVWLRNGQQQYWDTIDEAFCRPCATDVKREHARLEGVSYVLFDRRFRESNAIELANRRTAYFTLCVAAQLDLRPIRQATLAALNGGTLSLHDLAGEVGHNIHRVKAAVMSLWREARVALPMSECLMTDRWMVRRLSDVRR